MDNKEVMQQALEALERADKYNLWREQRYAIPAPEPVSTTYKEVADTMNMLWGGNLKAVAFAMELEKMKLYITPPQQELKTIEQQIARALRLEGLSLLKTANGYQIMRLEPAQPLKENT